MSPNSLFLVSLFFCVYLNIQVAEDQKESEKAQGEEAAGGKGKRKPRNAALSTEKTLQGGQGGRLSRPRSWRGGAVGRGADRCLDREGRGLGYYQLPV